MGRHYFCGFWVLAVGAVTVALGVSVAALAQKSRGGDEIHVLNPKVLSVSSLPAERTAIGKPGDYKPCVARLPSGELLLVAFHQNQLGGGKVREETILFRSADGGLTWSERQVLDVLGREPYLTVLGDGTVFITVHLLAQDVRNKDGYTHSYVHRSADGGRTWTTTRIGPEGFAPRAETLTTRNVLELSDGTLLLGVAPNRGPEFLWRSTDRGRTWGRSSRCDMGGFRSSYSYFGEAVLWRTRLGKILSINRVDSNEFPIVGRPVPAGQGDQRDHMTLWESVDSGRSWRKLRDVGDYGEMYPSVLRLRDGRLLLTFTVRDLMPPLGVHAVLGRERDGGFEFDFRHDRLVLDANTPVGKPSGGGFGPSVQLEDGTLVTAYSYRGEDDATHLEIVRWRLPAER